MKREVSHLEKYRFVLETQEQKLMRQIANNQKKWEQEKGKHEMLNHCLSETQSNLQTLANNHISSMQYQQFQHFIFQLEKAIMMQNEVLNNHQKQHVDFIAQYQTLKVKRNNLQELINNIQKSNQFHENRKENQENTEIFNRLKPYQ
ncbi:flagellar export protein FliJ [Candidatus Berkiella aquae]|uniref:Flagellar FliJ protein n=1 Tax=Candidatus Berkiella aquae TaxID=295108 RepID=A0A0Q9YZ67_9GAMM|nr:flagellar FliJ family protein [Candidatus Berkiella aquae]MCS5711422.1 flagellar FliJ family protein [Candidatus Berkiella aquae]